MTTDRVADAGRRAPSMRGALPACAALCATVLLAGGCAGPGPRMFPPAPMERLVLDGGALEQRYDTDGDGRADFAERLGPDGLLVALRYDDDEDGTFDEEVELAHIDPAQQRDLIILLDSVPFEVAQEVWNAGRLRMFHPPARIISPFPVMTDLCFSEFFGVTPVPGVESEYYNGRTLTSGVSTYLGEGNTPWLRFVNYRMAPLGHASAYLNAHPWSLHELGRIEEKFFASRTGPFVGYSVGTSALGAQYGRNGHWAGLVRLDRFCQSVMQRTRGRTRITILSDHGHNLMTSQRARLTEMLTECGYRVAKRLERADDVVVPQFGVVTCAAIHTRAPARVARDVVGIEGVELAAYRDANGEVVVLDRDGLARISRVQSPPADVQSDGRAVAASAAPAATGDAPEPSSLGADRRAAPSDGRGGPGVRYRYVAQRGDPLALRPILEDLAARGLVDPDGFVDDEVLCRATWDHQYPDAVHRLWRAFHGLVAHPPDVLVSLVDGWHSGSPTISKIRRMHATHGNLRPLSSTAFAMTTAGRLPPVLRMEQLESALVRAGVGLPQAERPAALARR